LKRILTAIHLIIYFFVVESESSLKLLVYNCCTVPLFLWKEKVFKMLPQNGKQNSLKAVGKNLGFEADDDEVRKEKNKKGETPSTQHP
jgi:hypothetical protein